MDKLREYLATLELLLWTMKERLEAVITPLEDISLEVEAVLWRLREDRRRAQSEGA